MAAYAALVSVMQIIHQIQNHPSPPISIDKKQVESLTEIVTFLQEFLDGYKSPVADSDEADPLEMRIADAVYAAEDVIESNIVENIKLVAESNIVDRIQSQRNRMGFFNCFRSLKKTKNNGEKISIVDLYEGLKKVIEDMDLIKKQVAEIVAEKEKEVVQDQLQRQVSLASASITSPNSSSRSSLTRLNSTMVGFDNVSLEIMEKLTHGRLNRHVIPIIGMGGIGKTTLAKNIYARPHIKERFDICAWTTISQKYNTKEILCELLSQTNKDEIEQISKMREDEVGLALYQYLYGRRFLIVLDDMWSIEAWEKMQRYFPDNGNSSRILVTTRLSNLGSQLDNNYSLEMKFLDDVSSWGMFSEIVFKGESCPFELEIIGKKIVKSCRGLPLSIVVIGGLLEKVERTKKCWESIRRNLNSLVNSENDEHCLKILKISYNHLPVYLKPCFLYMGVFEEDRAIRVSTVIKLWVSEGFLKPISDESLEITAKRYIKELVDRNLILVHKLGLSGSVKSLKIHDLLRDLCLRESQKERFYHVVGQQSSRSTGSARCMVIPSGSVKKEVLNAIESTPYARSCITDDSKRVPLLPNLRFLRILNVFDRDRYYSHKYSLKEMFKVVNLRYLSVFVSRWSAKLPSSIHLLWSLQTLIVSYPNAKVVNACVEIWKMPQLRHDQFFEFRFHYSPGLHLLDPMGLHLLDPVGLFLRDPTGLILPDPPRDNIVIMENLQTLTGVLNFKFDEEVVRRIPNIKKLRLIYDKDKRNDDRFCLHNIECLHKLESLSCVCLQGSDYWKKLSFPHSLKKLNLHMRTMNADFEDMLMLAKIGSLPLLQKLSLYGGRFKTGTWEVVEGQFPSLKFLLLEWFYNLEIWTTESSPFPCLEYLHLYGLNKLKEIPTEIGEIPTLKSIVLFDCNTSAVKSMKKIVEEQQDLQGDDLPFKVRVFLGKKENEELQKLANPNFQVTRLL